MNRQTTSQTLQDTHTAPPLLVGGLLQRQCACGQHTIAGACSSCTREDKPGLQRSATTPTSLDGVPQIVGEVLRSPGLPLDTATRAFMEPRFGHDFSRVRVHTDTKAAESARAVNALAYTVGHNIVFGSGQHAPETRQGRGLFAHELTHVVQQGGTARSEHLKLDSGDSGSPEEREAHAAANAIATGADFSPRAKLHRLVARKPAAAPACANPGNSRSVTLQPVFFKSSATDDAPTGHTLHRRLGPANRIWGKLGVHFATATPVVIVDATLKVGGGSAASTTTVMAANSGDNIEVFFVDNQMTWTGGAYTDNCPGAASKIALSDHGSDHNLLAHELGHVLGIGHPSGSGVACGSVADANTVMTPSDSNDTMNSSRNTMVNFGLISWPAAGAATCLHPDA